MTQSSKRVNEWQAAQIRAHLDAERENEPRGEMDELLREGTTGTEGRAILKGDGEKEGRYRSDEWYMDDNEEYQLYDSENS